MTEEHEVVIQFRNVTKTFDLFKNDKQRLKSLLFHNTNAKKKVAIDNLSFDIRQGEAVAILGKNGAGSDLFQRAMAEVLQEATDEELSIAAGSEKNLVLATDAQMTDMHELFRSRAEQKVNQYRDEKGKNL